MERALHGVEAPVYCYGKIIGTRRVYNDALLMFMLRNRAGKRFTADSLHNADAATRSQLERLKHQWRQQWEAEAQARTSADADEITSGINTRLDTMRQRWLENMSPRVRDLYEAWQQAETEDKAAPPGDQP